jgi:glycosyltransferase involved in cell wall biosynthesis
VSLAFLKELCLSGKSTPEEATLYRRVADIFVMPSRSEGLGISGLSAMASRLPFIGTREGGMAEYVCDEAHPHSDAEYHKYGKTAWAVAKDSPEAIAHAVQDILAHPEEVREVVARARRMIEERFNWDIIAREMEKRVFQPVLKDMETEALR